YTINVSAVNVSFDLIDISNLGLQGGENFFALPTSGAADAALQVDLSGRPSGEYEYTLTTGVRRFDGKEFVGPTATSKGTLVVVNSINSPFGSGWGLAGLQQLVVNPDNTVLLIDGDGTQLLFRPPATPGGAYIDPLGDMSMLERLHDGTFRRTLPDQTTYVFNAQNIL